MFDRDFILAALRAAGLDRPLYFFERTGSTNDDARRLAEAGAPHGTLVVAAEQTAGRGRAGRTWASPPGSSLAASFVLRWPERGGSEPGGPLYGYEAAGALSMLGGLAAAEAVEGVSGIHAELKWPNDVLLNRRKVAGVLVEASWVGERLEYAVLGVGVNVGGDSVPPPDSLSFPATSLEEEAGRSIERVAVLVEIVRRLEAWWPRLGEPELAAAWESRLAFRGETVRVETAAGVVSGVAVGVTSDGALKLQRPEGGLVTVWAGDAHLRAVDSGPN